MDFTVPANHRVKIKKTNLDLNRKLKTMEHEDDGDTNCVWCTWDNPQKIGKETGKLGNKRTSTDHPESRRQNF